MWQKIPSNVMLELDNMRNRQMWEKIRLIPNVTKILSNMMLKLHNVIIESLNVRKYMGTTKCDKITITCDIGTA